MEVAGLVLGAVPLIIYALEKYEQKFTDERVIRDLKSGIELQKKILHRTLGKMGAKVEGDNGIPMIEIETTLRKQHPSDWKLLLNVVELMNEHMIQVATQLYPDTRGPVSFH
jgi:hypothetical protein